MFKQTFYLVAFTYFAQQPYGFSLSTKYRVRESRELSKTNFCKRMQPTQSCSCNIYYPKFAKTNVLATLYPPTTICQCSFYFIHRSLQNTTTYFLRLLNIDITSIYNCMLERIALLFVNYNFGHSPAKVGNFQLQVVFIQCFVIRFSSIA